MCVFVTSPGLKGLWFREGGGSLDQPKFVFQSLWYRFSQWSPDLPLPSPGRLQKPCYGPLIGFEAHSFHTKAQTAITGAKGLTLVGKTRSRQFSAMNQPLKGNTLHVTYMLLTCYSAEWEELGFQKARSNLNSKQSLIYIIYRLLTLYMA